jgi:hypothetical protein
MRRSSHEARGADAIVARDPRDAPSLYCDQVTQDGKAGRRSVTGRSRRIGPSAKPVAIGGDIASERAAGGAIRRDRGTAGRIRAEPALSSHQPRALRVLVDRPGRTAPTERHHPMTASRSHATLRPLAALTASAVALAAGADTITVCPDGSCDFTDPIAAVDAAISGDVVEIKAGVYPLASTMVLYGKNLTIRGAVDADGRPATVLDGQGARTVFSAVSTIEQSRLENLVLANGRAEYGGGVFLSGVDLVFQNCHLRDNIADWQGGAIFLSGSTAPTLIDCRITGNASGNSAFPGSGRGGAVSVGNGTLTLVGCSVSGNSADSHGGALLLTSSSTVILESTRICGNTAPTDAQFHLNGGGGTILEGAGTCISDDCDDCPACPADLTRDGVVGAPDLATMLIAWGACGKSCAADLDGDGAVGASDLSILLGSWGVCD